MRRLMVGVVMVGCLSLALFTSVRTPTTPTARTTPTVLTTSASSTPPPAAALSVLPRIVWPKGTVTSTAAAPSTTIAAPAIAAQGSTAVPASTIAPTPIQGPSTTDGVTDAESTNTADWECIRFHESSDNYGIGGGGAYQFESGTWQSTTGLPGNAQDYPPAVQDAAALKLYSERGFEPWTTRFVCGLG